MFKTHLFAVQQTKIALWRGERSSSGIVFVTRTVDGRTREQRRQTDKRARTLSLSRSLLVVVVANCFTAIATSATDRGRSNDGGGGSSSDRVRRPFAL